MAIEFDGTNDCLTTSGNGNNILRDSSFTNTNYSFTVSCWVRPHGKQNSVIWSQYLTSGSGQGGRLALEMVSSNKKFTIRSSAGSASSGDDAYIDSSTNWYHLVCTFTWPDRYLYVNGNVDSPAISDISDRNSLHEKNGLATIIGARREPNNTDGDSTTHELEMFFDGVIAEWAAWNRVLTSGEIQSLYAGVSPIMVRADHLLAYFPLGGPYVDSTNPYRDITNQKSLTVVDSPTFVANPNAEASVGLHMLYPHAGPTTVYTTTPSEEEEEEAALTGSDVIHEIITANDRKQGGICVHSGGTTFAKRDNNIQIAAQNQVTELNNKYVEESRQDHRDEISTDTNNSDGWFGV